MITGELKNKVDKIWEIFWTGGLANPLDVIEQLTYLMFVRDLDQIDQTRQRESLMLSIPHKSVFQGKEQLKWSIFIHKSAEDMYKIMQAEVFPFIKQLNGNSGTYAKYMADAIFKVPTPQLLERLVTELDELYTQIDKMPDKQDARGDLYEYMLGKLATAGRNGQFRTPLHIIDMMVELVQPTPDDFICDPACGTAGFLVSSAKYVRKHYGDDMTPEQWQHFAGPMFAGFDMDRTMLRISAMNLMLHSITNPDIDYKDSVSKQNSICSKYTVCLANPPFKGTVDAESINDDLKAVTNTKKTELLFLALFLRMLKTGGRCACIVPDGVLFGSSKAHQSIRKELIENHQLRAVISMPSGVFKPYAGVSTAVLVFTKTGAGGTDKVWFYDMKADGFSLDDKRTEVKENDIPDIIARFQNLDAETDRKRTEQSFFVPKEEIAANGYDLSINKYKETEYVPVEYPSTTEILADLHELEMEITKGLAELEEMV